MIVGVPKEIKAQEHRVGLIPSTALMLTRKGHTVLVQKSAGIGSGYPDQAYIDAGAQIIDTAKKVYAQAEMIVKVKEPLKAEYGLLRKEQILFTYLHLAASKPLTEALLKFLRNPIKRVVVVADDDPARPVGMLTPFDILQTLPIQELQAVSQYT